MTDKKEELVGFQKIGDDPETWQGILGWDEHLLLTTPMDLLLVGTRELCIEELRRRNPVPPEYPTVDGISRIDVSSDNMYIAGIKDPGSRGCWRYVTFLKVFEYPLLGSVSDPEFVLPAGPLATDDISLGALREEWPWENGYVTSTREHYCVVRYDPKKAATSLKQSRSQASRDALYLEELESFSTALACDVCGVINGHRGGITGKGYRMTGQVTELASVLAKYNLVFGNWAYRKTREYDTFLRRVCDTRDATFRKWRDWPGFVEWLEFEMSSTIGRRICSDQRKLRKGKIKYQQYYAVGTPIAKVTSIFTGQQLLVKRKLKEKPVEKEEGQTEDQQAGSVEGSNTAGDGRLAEEDQKEEEGQTEGTADESGASGEEAQEENQEETDSVGAGFEGQEEVTTREDETEAGTAEAVADELDAVV